MEIYGRGRIVELANTTQHLNVLGDQALDLRTLKPNGQPWDFTPKSDRIEALVVKDRIPRWVIRSPPCTACSSIMNLNHVKTSKTQIDRIMTEARTHLRFMVDIYRIQLAGGRHVLRKHPAPTSSWKDPAMTLACRL